VNTSSFLYVILRAYVLSKTIQCVTRILRFSFDSEVSFNFGEHKTLLAPLLFNSYDQKLETIVYEQRQHPVTLQERRLFLLPRFSL